MVKAITYFSVFIVHRQTKIYWLIGCTVMAISFYPRMFTHNELQFARTLYLCCEKITISKHVSPIKNTYYGRSDLWTLDPAIFERDSNTHRYSDAGGSWNTRNCYLSGSLCYGSVTQTHKPILLRESDEPKPYFFPYSVVLLRDGNLLCCWSCTFSLDKRDIGLSIFLAFEH